MNLDKDHLRIHTLNLEATGSGGKLHVLLIVSSDAVRTHSPAQLLAAAFDCITIEEHERRVAEIQNTHYAVKEAREVRAHAIESAPRDGTYILVRPKDASDWDGLPWLCVQWHGPNLWANADKSTFLREDEIRGWIPIPTVPMEEIP